MNSVLKFIPAAALSLLALAGCGETKAPHDPKPADVKPAGTAPVAPKVDAPAEKKAEAPAEKKVEPAGEKPAEATPGAAPATPAGATVEVKLADSGRTLVVPSIWKQQEPSNRMRMAEFKVPKAANDSDDAEMAIFKMGGGGGFEGNLARWTGSFGGANSLKLKRTLKTAAGVEATIAELEGEYSAMTMEGTAAPKKGYAMMGAVIIVEKGEFYVKFTGPIATIDANKANFNKMIESFK